MSTAALIVAAIAVIPAFGMAAWIWMGLACMDDELESFVGYAGLRFED